MCDPADRFPGRRSGRSLLRGDRPTTGDTNVRPFPSACGTACPWRGGSAVGVQRADAATGSTAGAASATGSAAGWGSGSGSAAAASSRRLGRRLGGRRRPGEASAGGSATAVPAGAVASTLPTSTVSPSWTRISATTPSPGLGTPVSTLSVDISSSGSSRATSSPAASASG